MCWHVKDHEDDSGNGDDQLTSSKKGIDPLLERSHEQLLSPEKISSQEKRSNKENTSNQKKTSNQEKTSHSARKRKKSNVEKSLEAVFEKFERASTTEFERFCTSCIPDVFQIQHYSEIFVQNVDITMFSSFDHFCCDCHYAFFTSLFSVLDTRSSKMIELKKSTDSRYSKFSWKMSKERKREHMS